MLRKDFSEFKQYIKGKKVAVVGIGVSNIPLINFLNKLGANVTGFDMKSHEELGADKVEAFKKKGVELSLGKDYLDNLTGFDVVFKTPSMRIDNEYLVRAQSEGAYITSEMEEFIRYCPAKIYGITGSDGKTTTTTLIYNILKEEGYKTWVGGNIGNPLFDQIENMTNDDKVVLELSSFQLMTIKLPMEVTVVTNLTPNHLDMHKGMEEYIQAKKNIFEYQEADGLLVINKDDEITANFKNEAKGRVKEFSLIEETNAGYLKNNTLYVGGKAACNREDVKLIGIHNVANLLTAFSAVSDEVSVESMKKVATTFTGVEHRAEFVRELEGVKYYNDSIASSPTRTLAGLKAFDTKVVLIAGGYDKQLPFEVLAREGYPYVKELILLGLTKEKIKREFEKVIEEKNVEINIHEVNSLEEAVQKAKEVAVDGDIVTLSPACASFDMFPNFMIRGNKFKEIIKEL